MERARLLAIAPLCLPRSKSTFPRAKERSQKPKDVSSDVGVLMSSNKDLETLIADLQRRDCLIVANKQAKKQASKQQGLHEELVRRSEISFLSEEHGEHGIGLEFAPRCLWRGEKREYITGIE